MKIDPQNMEKRYLHELMASSIVPRPIALISTVGEDGVYNLAPFADVAPVCMKPPLVGIQISWNRDGRKKDTLRNIEFGKDFVINVVDEPLGEAMNQTSAEYPSNVDEFKEVGLTALKCDRVRAPRLAESPVNMECKLVQILEFGECPTGGFLVIGEVILFHIQDQLWADGQVDVSKLHAIARLGGSGSQYCRTRDIFVLQRPYKPY